MSESTIDFYWEPSSPYSYLASTQIDAVAQRLGVRLLWKPFLLGKAFEATGNRMNVAVPAKGNYMFDDLELLARHYRLPLSRPAVFPVSSVVVARAVLAAPPDRQAELSKAMMRTYWGEGRDVGQVAELRQVIAGTGLDADAVLARTQDPAVKDELRRNTEEAIARGVFGAPSFYANGKLFWGCDRVWLMEEWVAGRLGH